MGVVGLVMSNVGFVMVVVFFYHEDLLVLS